MEEANHQEETPRLGFEYHAHFPSDGPSPVQNKPNPDSAESSAMRIGEEMNTRNSDNLRIPTANRESNLSGRDSNLLGTPINDLQVLEDKFPVDIIDSPMPATNLTNNQNAASKPLGKVWENEEEETD